MESGWSEERRQHTTSLPLVIELYLVSRDILDVWRWTQRNEGSTHQREKAIDRGGIEGKMDNEGEGRRKRVFILYSRVSLLEKRVSKARFDDWARFFKKNRDLLFQLVVCAERHHETKEVIVNHPINGWVLSPPVRYKVLRNAMRLNHCPQISARTIRHRRRHVGGNLSRSTKFSQLLEIATDARANKEPSFQCIRLFPSLQLLKEIFYPS